MIYILCALSLVSVCVGDLRMASQPKNGWKAIDRGNVKFVPDYALYMEPSDFNYEGLKKQRAKAYDNFLRSNIDNEQDRRNFVTEPGEDHLPFRSYATAANDNHGSVETKLPKTFPKVEAGKSAAAPAITVDLGKAFNIPLRWNNPHASELEVNIWIMNTGAPKPIVVPIRKPACSAEGHQDNVFTFTVPTDFNNLGSKVKNFKGCKNVGDCVLQVYAHSVESRTYAIGTPLIVNGNVPTATAPNNNGVIKPKEDVGVNLDDLKNADGSPHFLCTSSADPNIDIKTSVPQEARLVSDLFNHAYQNSDFSPYSGQQPHDISRNLQASVILKMVPANRGELGKALLKSTKAGRNAANAAKKADGKARNLVRLYESITNQLISAVMEKQDSVLINNDTMTGENPNDKSGKQNTNTCFRCAETGSTTAKRQTTNTYVPSFVIDKTLLGDPTAPLNPSKPTAYDFVAKVHQRLIKTGRLELYETVLDEMKPEFEKLAKMEYPLFYQGPVLKDTLTTIAFPGDNKHRKKVTTGNKNDGGLAAAKAAETFMANRPKKTVQNGAVSGLGSIISSDSTDFIAEPQLDMNGVGLDSNCDDDKLLPTLQAKAEKEGTELQCTIPGSNVMTASQLFPEEGQIAAPGTYIAQTGGASVVGASVFSLMCVVVSVIFQM